MEPLATMRIQTSLNCDLYTQGSNGYHALDHIQLEIRSVEHGLHDAVLLAIPLGKSQFDLAVKQATVRQIKNHFTDLSHSRLVSYDPLFAAEFGRSFPETAFSALTQMRYQYNLAASSIHLSKDPRLIKWFKAEIKRIEILIDEYRQQCVNLGRIPDCVKQQ
ncbi:hypothetical protein DTO013E5_9372 [Penicillium roqueforti]|nr:hypothetical protein CBS147355_9597 [Penicillium roqueforti]KAI2671948.1 hypothetical protein LCP963914a_9579 [Penicillium roqueforti]KAI2708767.1 hypothetical protein CBS147318_9475 [Penicillium roqueforti]KAI2735507.1 hypothetical protein DTO012A1_9219 [Penicillium roqueforti]KAI2751077.1 hypothetical protein DTO006G1_9802 [Penicillium roqueforti]